MFGLKDLYQFLFSRDVLDNIVVSVMSGFLLSLIAALFHFRLPNFSVLLFWKRFAQGITIVTSGVKKAAVDPHVRPEQSLTLLLYGEVVALGDLLHFFRGQCKTDPQIALVQDPADFDRIKDTNLLLLGGPKYNGATKQFLQEIAPELFYQFKRLLPDRDRNVPDTDLKVLAGRSAEYPDFTGDFAQESQYATIIFRKDLYVSGKAVLCAAGLSNASTLAAVTWICNRPASFWLRVRQQQKGFQAVITCRELDQAKVSKVELAFFRELE